MKNISKCDTLMRKGKKMADMEKMAKKYYDARNKAAGYVEKGWGKDESTVDPYDWEILQKRNKNNWNCDFGWKIHLDVIPNREAPDTKEISDFLLNLEIAHKIAAGGQLGKGMTVYVGGYFDACRLAHIIQEQFKDKMYIPPFFADQVQGEYPFEPMVYGTFCVADFDYYPRYGLGLRPLVKPCVGEEDGKYNMLACFHEATKMAQEVGLSVPNFFDRRKKEQNVFALQCYCSHKLYARAFGRYYYGHDLGEFEQKFFGDKVPNKGTNLRKKWDLVADAFVNVAQSNGFLQQLVKSSGITGYIPVDFDKLTRNNMIANVRNKWSRGQ